MKFNKEVFVWECRCGNTELSGEPPEECMKCWRLNSFVRLPDDKENELGGVYR